MEATVVAAIICGIFIFVLYSSHINAQQREAQRDEILGDPSRTWVVVDKWENANASKSSCYLEIESDRDRLDVEVSSFAYSEACYGDVFHPDSDGGPEALSHIAGDGEGNQL